jgi:hypothetical protein
VLVLPLTSILEIWISRTNVNGKVNPQDRLPPTNSKKSGIRSKP